MTENERLEFETLRRSNVLWGKSLVVCGDSFTEGDFTSFADGEGHTFKESPVIYDKVKKVYKTYPWWIAERNNMKLTNLAKCGGCIALTKKYTDEHNEEFKDYKVPFSNERYKKLGDNIDYILIMYGLNDMCCCELGTIDDETNETFYGAFNVVYKYLIEKYPRTKIGVMVCNAYLSVEFANAVRETAVKWGIPYLDLMSDTSLPATLSKTGMCAEAREIRNKHYFVSETNHHPNILAHELMSTYVEDFLRKI